VLGAGLLLLSACASPGGSLPPSPASSTNPREPLQYAAQIVRETNAVRQAQRLPGLLSSPCARQAAISRAAALIGKAELTHAPLAGVIARCAPPTTAAENLSRAASSPTIVVAAWMRSPGHRSNLLDPALTEIGVGCLPDGTRMLCSQVFLGP
jgi:uncharacterized protein YkwD